MKYGIVLIAGVCLCAAAQGETFYVKSSATDWSLPASFTTDKTDGTVEAATTPVSTDAVILPTTCSYSFTYGTESFNVFANVKQINFTHLGNARLTVNVPNENDVANIRCTIFRDPFENHSYRYCELVKEGSGVLNLNGIGVMTRSNCSWDYYCNLTVNGGVMKLQPELVQTGATTYIGKITVAEGAEFWIAGSSTKIYTTAPRAFAGAGVITNAYGPVVIDGSNRYNTFNTMVIRTDDASEFSGTFGGNINLMFSGPIRITGTGATTGLNPCFYASGSFDYATWGMTEIKYLGNRSLTTPTTCGKGNFTVGGSGNGGGFIYVGEGETTDKIFLFNGNSNDSKFPSVIDAGATGGIVFKKSSAQTTASWYGTGKHSQRVVLTGSNTIPCRVQYVVKDWNNGNGQDGVMHSLHFMKRGTGTWVFEGDATNSLNAGGISVENGVLQYASLDEKGCKSALGTATNTTRFIEKNATMAQHDALVPYAITLGGTNANEKGVLEYIGTGLGKSLTRPVVMAGRGKLSNAGTGRLVIGDVTSRDADGVTTLYLGGTNAAVNVLADVTNGVGTINLVKEDSGTWRLVRNVDVASIAVDGGTLVVDNRPDYRYFRLTCKQTLDAGKTFPQLQEVALFTDDGARCNVGMTYVSPAVTTNGQSRSFVSRTVMDKGVCGLEPNEAAYGYATGTVLAYYAGTATAEGNQNRDMGTLFDGGWNTDASQGPVTSAGWLLNRADTSSNYPVLGNESTWIPIVMRVSDETPRVTSFDLVAPSGVAVGTEVTAWSLEASADGFSWETITNYCNTSGATNHTNKARWYSDWSNFTSGEVSSRAGKGFRFEGYVTDSLAVPSWATIPVSVAAGATLRINGQPVTISKLALNGQGADATLDGVVLSSSGTLDVEGIPDGTVVRLPVAFTNAADSVSNLSQWTLKIGNGPANGRRLKVAGGDVFVTKPGMMVSFR